eukprot:s1542_g25.t1
MCLLQADMICDTRAGGFKEQKSRNPAAITWRWRAKPPMHVATVFWLLPLIADCHWQIQRRSQSVKKEWNQTSERLSANSLSTEEKSEGKSFEHDEVRNVDRNVTDNSSLPNSSWSSIWRCSPKGGPSWLLLQAVRLGILESKQPGEGPADPCFVGFTKFFWATLLAVMTLVGICLLVPVMLEITRRRPPGVPLVLFGITFDCEPKPHADSYDFYSMKPLEAPRSESVSPLARQK